MSPGAITSSTSVCPRPARSVTLTSSGLSGQRPGHHLDDVVRAAHDAAASRRRRRLRRHAMDQRAHRIGGLRPLLQPVREPLAIELQGLGLGPRIVVPQHFDEAAVARGPGVGHDDAEKRPLLRTCASQTNYQHYRINPFSADMFGRFLPNPAIPPIALSIFFIWMNCFSKRFTSSTVVPDPLAIRLRRLPLITWWLRALLRRHRVDDRFDPQQLLVVDLLALLLELLQRAHAGQHAENLLERPHLADGPQLIAKVLEREIVEPNLLLELLRVFPRDGLFGLLDQREHVAHAEHARHDAVGVKRLEILQPLAAADKRDRHADDRDDRERGAAARVTIHLRQHDAGDADPAVELAGALDRVLPGHRVGDEQQIDGPDRRLDRLQLVHQLVVDVQTTRGVDNHDVEPAVLRLGQRAGRRAPPDRVCPAGSCTRTPACLPTTESCSIAAGRRTSVETSSG